MKKLYSIANFKMVFSVLLLFISLCSFAQDQPDSHKAKSDFWNKVQFGGGLGLGIGSDYTDISVSPTAIYNANKYFSVGTGLQLSYSKAKNIYSSIIYGGSLIGLVNPIEEIQLSVELEQLRVNRSFQAIPNNIKDNFWSTGLYLGAGYRANNVTIGAKYNVLYDKNKSVYSNAFMPFVRVFF